MPCCITLDFLVSNEISWFEYFFFINWIVSVTLAISSCSLTDFAPGLVDSPPTSMIWAPKSIMLLTWSIALKVVLYFPPSEKLSGVTFKTPIKIGFLKFKLRILFLMEVILFKSLSISFLKSNLSNSRTLYSSIVCPSDCLLRISTDKKPTSSNPQRLLAVPAWIK